MECENDREIIRICCIIKSRNEVGEDMDKLQKARIQINEIDEKMAVLFQDRMKAVEDVIAYKQQHQMKVLDQSREQDVINKNIDKLKDDKYKNYYRTFITDVMAISRSYQKAILYHDCAGYAGTQGAFSHIATKALFKNSPMQAYPTFEDVFKAVKSNEIAYGVIPFENSYTGEVGEILDLLLEYDVYINQIYDLKIDQNLLGIKGSTLSNIKQVYSKDQAISQCRAYLKGRDFEIIPYPNTALAAQFIAKENDPTKAAIASKETAELYGLDIIEEKINTNEDNTTRFIVIENNLKKQGNRFNLFFTLKHNAGELAKVMQVIADDGFNMENIRSRSLRNRPWEYYFYVEMEGTAGNKKEEKLMEDLKLLCEKVKLLGCYNKESRDEQ